MFRRSSDDMITPKFWEVLWMPGFSVAYSALVVALFWDSASHVAKTAP